MTFLDEGYLLTNPTATQIYQEIEYLPIIDTHNHVNIAEIRENKNYEDIWHVEAATDHYVWELLRNRGVKEKFITGKASPEEKWKRLAKVFPDFVGNPVYEWVHLDLKRRFGIGALINEDNAEMIWNQTKQMLKQSKFTPQALLEEMNVEIMCSTDDPIDLLEHHKALKNSSCPTKILPTWSPDKAMQINKEGFQDYIQKLGDRTNKKIVHINDLIRGLQDTHDYFEQIGAKASDHGIQIPFGYKVNRQKADKIFKKRLLDKPINDKEEKAFKSYLLHKFGEMNVESNWVMQLHIGAIRDYRESLYDHLGPDSGGDVSNHLIPIVKPLKAFLNTFDGNLKLVLYALDPTHYSTLATLSRAFGEKVSLGAAWWFNDSPVGMKRQLKYISSVDLLINFAGMVSDSRKLMSYGSRTEMFRRVLADVLGQQVENGQIPLNLAIQCAKYICYERKKDLFEL